MLFIGRSHRNVWRNFSHFFERKPHPLVGKICPCNGRLAVLSRVYWGRAWWWTTVWLLAAPNTLERNQSYVFTASRVRVSPRGDASGQQQFGERTGRQESMRASVASTLLQVCSSSMGDRILCVHLFLFQVNPIVRWATLTMFLACFLLPTSRWREERIREGRGTADSSRGGLDRHCRSQ